MPGNPTTKLEHTNCITGKAETIGSDGGVPREGKTLDNIATALIQSVNLTKSVGKPGDTACNKENEHDSQTVGTSITASSKRSATSRTVTMSSVRNTEDANKKQRKVQSDDILARGMEVSRKEIFSEVIFYPSESWWGFDGVCGNMIADRIGHVVLYTETDDEDKVKEYRDNQNQWLEWFELENAAKWFQAAHTKRRANVISQLKDVLQSK